VGFLWLLLLLPPPTLPSNCRNRACALVFGGCGLSMATASIHHHRNRVFCTHFGGCTLHWPPLPTTPTTAYNRRKRACVQVVFLWLLPPIVLEGPVSRLPKDWDWTGPRPDEDRKFPRPEKTKTAVRSLVFQKFEFPGPEKDWSYWVLTSLHPQMASPSGHTARHTLYWSKNN